MSSFLSRFPCKSLSRNAKFLFPRYQKKHPFFGRLLFLLLSCYLFVNPISSVNCPHDFSHQPPCRRRDHQYYSKKYHAAPEQCAVHKSPC